MEVLEETIVFFSVNNIIDYVRQNKDKQNIYDIMFFAINDSLYWFFFKDICDRVFIFNDQKSTIRLNQFIFLFLTQSIANTYSENRGLLSTLIQVGSSSIVERILDEI